MTINVIGDCDKRPVIYTILKIAQTMGDVLLITNRAMLRRLSDTGDTYGHYQNIMIAITQDGIDDFFDGFNFARDDFQTVVIDNLVDATSDVFIYVQGLNPTEEEIDMLESLDDYVTIDMYKGKYIDARTYYAIEEFEAFRDCCPMNQNLANVIGEILGPVYQKDPKNLASIAMTKVPGSRPATKSAPKSTIKKGTGKKMSLGGIFK